MPSYLKNKILLKILGKIGSYEKGGLKWKF